MLHAGKSPGVELKGLIMEFRSSHSSRGAAAACARLAGLALSLTGQPSVASPYMVSSTTTSKSTKLKFTFEDKDNGINETVTMPKVGFETPLIEHVLEFKLATSYRRVERVDRATQDGLGDTEVKLKWAIASAQAGARRPGFAIEPKLTLPTGSESKGLGSGSTELEIPLIVGWKFDRVELGAELAYVHTFGEHDGTVPLGVLGQYQATPALKLGVELVAEAPTDHFSDYEMSANAGFKWKLPHGLEVQGLIGRTVHTNGRDTDKLKFVFEKYF